MIKSQIYDRDLQKAYQSIVGVEKLRGKRVLITGGTGLVGEPVVDLLSLSGAEVYVAARSPEKVAEKFGDSVRAVMYDANEELQFEIEFDYMIHAASNAHPRAMMTQPVETLLANVSGVGRLLEYARKHQVERLLYVSSSEVYGQKDSSEAFSEDMYGYVNVLNARSCYPMGKRAAETLCSSYLTEYGVESVIARLGHIYGPTAARSDNRVSSAFAYQAADGQDIIMKSDGAQIRSYMYCLDCASAILTVLLEGKPGEAYNIANRNSNASIRQMAEQYASAAGVELRLEIPTDAEKAAFNPMSNSSLNSSKLETLGWNGQFDAETGFRHTIQIIREVAH